MPHDPCPAEDGRSHQPAPPPQSSSTDFELLLQSMRPRPSALDPDAIARLATSQGQVAPTLAVGVAAPTKSADYRTGRLRFCAALAGAWLCGVLAGVGGTLVRQDHASQPALQPSVAVAAAPAEGSGDTPRPSHAPDVTAASESAAKPDPAMPMTSPFAALPEWPLWDQRTGANAARRGPLRVGARPEDLVAASLTTTAPWSSERATSIPASESSAVVRSIVSVAAPTTSSALRKDVLQELWGASMDDAL